MRINFQVMTFIFSHWGHKGQILFPHYISKCFTGIDLKLDIELPYRPFSKLIDLGVVTLNSKVTKVKLCFCAISQKVLQVSIWNFIYSFPIGPLVSLFMLVSWPWFQGHWGHKGQNPFPHYISKCFMGINLKLDLQLPCRPLRDSIDIKVMTLIFKDRLKR